MAVVECPKCGKSLKVGDHLAGKRVRCPGCQKPFLIPDAPGVEVVEEEEEPQERVTRQPERRPAPRRRRNKEDEEEDDEPRRPGRRRPRDDDPDSVTFSSAPLVFGILSCLLSCSLVIGLYFAFKAIHGANAELDRLPGGKRGRAGRKQMQLAKTLGIVGLCLSFVMGIVAIVLKITDKL